MERRKANRCSYAKLTSKDPRTVSITSLRRSRSMRASFRVLKGKLNQANLATSPFKFNTPLHKGGKKNYEKMFGDSEEKVAEIKDIEITRKISKTLFKQSSPGTTTKMSNLPPCDSTHEDIETIMSALPMGDVPRKACKLLQIPETYCRKYLNELQQQQNLKQQQKFLPSPHCSETLKDSKDDMDKVDYVLTNNRKNHIYEDFSKSVGQGIYGTTRLRTATIRKPMPYLNSRRCFFLLLFVLLNSSF